MWSDIDIARGCQKSDPEFQKILYEKYSSKMFGVCLRYAISREEASDLLHEGFIKVFLNISQYKNEGSLEGWIHRIMVNNALMFLRKKKDIRFESIDHLESEEVLIGEEGDDDTLLNFCANLTQGEIIDILNQLPVQYKIIFNLYYIEDYNHKQISETLAISEVLSRKRLARARAMMRSHIISQFETKHRHTPVPTVKDVQDEKR